MKKIVNWFKKVFKKKTVKIDTLSKEEVKQHPSVDFLKRMEKITEPKDSEVSSNDILFYNNKKKSFDTISGEKKYKLVKKVKEKLAEHPETFLSDENPDVNDKLVSDSAKVFFEMKEDGVVLSERNITPPVKKRKYNKKPKV